MKRETVTMWALAMASVYFGISDLHTHGTINIMTIVIGTCSVLYFAFLIKEKGIDMFGFRRKSKERYPTWSDIPEIDYSQPLATPVEPPKALYSEDGYTIGVNEAGSTIMKVSCNYSTTTLTMNQSGVEQLIRLLEATLPHKEQPSEAE